MQHNLSSVMSRCQHNQQWCPTEGEGGESPLLHCAEYWVLLGRVLTWLCVCVPTVMAEPAGGPGGGPGGHSDGALCGQES